MRGIENKKDPEYFSAENKPVKQSIEYWMVNQIISTMAVDCCTRKDLLRGVEVISLTGPALTRHVDNYVRLVGTWGQVNSIECDEDIFKAQQTQWDILDKEKRTKTRVYLGDFFTRGKVILSQSRCRAVFIDADDIGTFENSVAANQEGIRALVQAIGGNVNTLFMSFTCCQRKQANVWDLLEGLKEEIPTMLRHEGWGLITRRLIPYRDQSGPPMMTSFFVFSRDRANFPSFKDDYDAINQASSRDSENCSQSQV